MDRLEILTKTDIMERYQCGKHHAEKIIRETKALCNGGVCCKGKVSTKELAKWEAAHGLS